MKKLAVVGIALLLTGCASGTPTVASSTSSSVRSLADLKAKLDCTAGWLDFSATQARCLGPHAMATYEKGSQTSRTGLEVVKDDPSVGGWYRLTDGKDWEYLVAEEADATALGKVLDKGHMKLSEAASAPKPAPTVTVTVTAKPAPAPTVTVTVTAPPEAPTGFGPGMHKVGDGGIPPGTYTATSTGGRACYYARLASASGSDIIDNNLAEGQLFATIAPTDAYFETSGCTPWTPA